MRRAAPPSSSGSGSGSSSADGPTARISGATRAAFDAAFTRATAGSCAAPAAFWPLRAGLWRVGRRLYATAGAPQVFDLDAPTGTAFGVRRWPAVARDPVVAALAAGRPADAAAAAGARSRRAVREKAARRAPKAARRAPKATTGAAPKAAKAKGRRRVTVTVEVEV